MVCVILILKRTLSFGFFLVGRFAAVASLCLSLISSFILYGTGSSWVLQRWKDNIIVSNMSIFCWSIGVERQLSFVAQITNIKMWRVWREHPSWWQWTTDDVNKWQLCPTSFSPLWLNNKHIQMLRLTKFGIYAMRKKLPYSQEVAFDTIIIYAYVYLYKIQNSNFDISTKVYQVPDRRVPKRRIMTST